MLEGSQNNNLFNSKTNNIKKKATKWEETYTKIKI